MRFFFGGLLSFQGTRSSPSILFPLSFLIPQVGVCTNTLSYLREQEYLRCTFVVSAISVLPHLHPKVTDSSAGYYAFVLSIASHLPLPPYTYRGCLPHRVRVDQFPSSFQVDVLSHSPLIFYLLAFDSLSLSRSEESRDRRSISDSSPSLGRVSRLRIRLFVVCEGVSFSHWLRSPHENRKLPRSLFPDTASSLGGGLSLHLSRIQVELFFFVPSTVFIPSRTLAPVSLGSRGSCSDTCVALPDVVPRGTISAQVPLASPSSSTLTTGSRKHYLRLLKNLSAPPLWMFFEEYFRGNVFDACCRCPNYVFTSYDDDAILLCIR